MINKSRYSFLTKLTRFKTIWAQNQEWIELASSSPHSFPSQISLPYSQFLSSTAMAAQGLTVVSTIPSSSTSHQSSRKPHEQVLTFSLTNSSFLGTKLSIIRSSFTLVASNRRNPILATVSSLPVTVKEGVSGDKIPGFSATAIKAFSMGELEARKIKFHTTSTAGVLMGILIEGTSEASQFLRENGVYLFEVRDLTTRFLGIGNYYITPPERPPLTEHAQRALDWAVEAKLKSGDSGEITPTHLLLGIWVVKESTGHKILARLGFNDEKAKELAKTVDLNLDQL